MTTHEKLRLVAGKPELSDDLIQIYIEAAEADIVGYCNVDTLPEGCESAVIELAAFYISRQGIEGTTSYGAGGVSYGYGDGIPLNIRQRIQRHVKGRVLAL